MNIEKIAEDLNLKLIKKISQSDLKAYWIGGWKCTDTWVGYVMYFLKDEPVCVSYHNDRDSEIEFEWFGVRCAESVRKYLLSLIEKSTYKVNCADLDEDFGEGYNISFNSQIVHGYKALFEGNEVIVIDKLNDTDTLIVIQFEDGSEKTVKTESLLFQFNL